MAWVEVGGNRSSGSGFSGDRSPINKWNSIGQSVEGTYQGMRQGKYGPLLIVQTPAGEVVYATSSVLVGKIKEGGIKEGDRIRVEYLGKRQSAAGVEYRNFLVQRDNGGPIAPPATAHKTEDARMPEFRHDEFERLKKLIAKDKGQGIADALSAAAQMAGDPIQSLREAMDQIGVVQF